MVRLRRKLDSEILYLPELRYLIGKTVEILVTEAMGPEIAPGTGDWDAAARAAKELRESGYDFDAWRSQRDQDRNPAQRLCSREKTSSQEVPL